MGIHGAAGRKRDLQESELLLIHFFAKGHTKKWDQILGFGKDLVTSFNLICKDPSNVNF